jgi:hypothetical protein
VFSYEIVIELKIVSVLYLDSDVTQVNQAVEPAIPTETQLVGGGAPDPPFWLLTTQVDDFWFLPTDSSSS